MSEIQNKQGEGEQQSKDQNDGKGQNEIQNESQQQSQNDQKNNQKTENNINQQVDQNKQINQDNSSQKQKQNDQQINKKNGSDNSQKQINDQQQPNSENPEDNNLKSINNLQQNNQSQVLDNNSQSKNHLQQQSNNNSMNKFQQTNQISQLWKPYDFVFPGGKIAKLVKINECYAKNFPFTEILNKVKLSEGYPIINLIAAQQSNRGSFYAGIARACFNSDAVIVDSLIETGIEKYALRKSLTVIGVAPENCVKFPKTNPSFKQTDEISNCHTHIFLLNDSEKKLTWTQESAFKIQLILRLAEGKTGRAQNRRQKILNILFADNDNYEDEVRLALKYKMPVLVVSGSNVCDDIIENQNKEEKDYKYISKQMQELLQNQKIYTLKSNNSEDIAQYIHFFMGFTPY